ncbi:hypothetical protein QQP08_006160 [Theobroma cacao]|nr:hypothetical protein QQP08_006160 [Theobroma cacao]
MENMSLVPRCKSEKMFLRKCKNTKNAKALYKKRMLNYFSKSKPELGLSYLKKVVDHGHIKAKYGLGVVF